MEDITPESNHPVLQQLKDRITELEEQLSREIKLHSDAVSQRFRFREEIKNVLTAALEDHDEDTIKHIADELNIDLSVSKVYEVNITFRIEVDTEVGETVDPSWDFSFSVDSDSSRVEISDYSTDIVWHNEV